MSNKVLFIFIAVAIFIGVVAAVMGHMQPAPVVVPETASSTTESAACPADAMQCADGLFVGRTGPNCEFVCPAPTVPADVQKEIDKKADLIVVENPVGMSVIASPLLIKGQARGNWFFEGSAPVSLVDWDGLIIAEGTITAEGDWMTTEFVPFSATFEFISPFQAGDQDFMKRGSLIFKKDNPSGLPENDDALEIPVLFSN